MTAVRYDLLAIGQTEIPDVKKGTLTFAKSRKKKEFECMDGSYVEEVMQMKQMSGNVSYNGLLESELQTICDALDDGIGTMTLYDPSTRTTITSGTKTITIGTVITFDASFENIQFAKILHDNGASAWSLSFDFKKIGDIVNA